MGKMIKAKHYHLSGKGMVISFSREDPNKTVLIYEDTKGESEFTGHAIYSNETIFGFVASVVLESIPDLQEILFSLIVPIVNLPDNVKSIPVKTYGIRSITKTGIGGPDMVEGQIQIYDILPLAGNAW